MQRDFGPTWRRESIRSSMSETVLRGLLDTSVVIDFRAVDSSLLPDVTAISATVIAEIAVTSDSSLLPDVTAISAITVAELAAGPHATQDEIERARRQHRLQWVVARWDPLPFDGDVARAFGLIYAATRASGRTGRRRFADLLIAATALAHSLALYTRNPDDFEGLEQLVAIKSV